MFCNTVDAILEGWSCRLNPEFGDGESMFVGDKMETQKDPTESPRASVVFLSPDFKVILLCRCCDCILAEQRLTIDINFHSFGLHFFV